MQILKKLYNGEVIPHERPMKPSPERSKAVDTLEETEHRLKEMLDEQGQALLDKYLKAHGDLGCEDCLSAFIEGFRVGGLLMLALFSDDL